MHSEWMPIEFEYKDLKRNLGKIIEVSEGTKPVLIIRNFYDPNLCKIVINNTKKYSNFKKGVFKKIGTSLLSYLTQKSGYFSQADASREIFHKIFEGIEDPRKKIHHVLSEFYPKKTIKVATEGIKRYACGVIRFHELGDFADIHRDCVKYEAPNFEVSNLSNQLSAVLHLQQSELGGELVIHKKIWTKSDEKFRNITFGYSKKVLLDSPTSIKVKPKQGDLVIINPIYYHEVLPVKSKKKRITLGLFFAFSKYQKEILTWS